MATSAGITMRNAGKKLSNGITQHDDVVGRYRAGGVQ
jgi:hypothetical protein